MSERSGIEWCDASWTPLRARNPKTGKVGWHCELASPGCEHCYSQAQNRRYGTGLSFVRRSRDEAEPFLDEKMLTAPLRWRKPKKIFVCANTDLFGEWVPDEWIDRIFAVMALAPEHVFQVLTKRAKRMREWFERTASGADRGTIVYESKPGFSEKGGRNYWPGWPLPNVWLGVSAEDQQRLDERAGDLYATPAAVRFWSLEPLLGAMDLGFTSDRFKDKDGPYQPVSWAIVGSESGPGRRETDIEWVRSIRDQCSAAGVPLFLKQLHEGGKKISLPKLDGRTWSEFPEVRA